MNVAMILAGGIGSRMGSDVPKQFVQVRGRPVIAYGLDTFQHHPLIDLIEVVCVEPYIEVLNSIVAEEGFDKVKIIVAGGNSYQGSVINGLKGLEGACAPSDVVVTHMAANPIVFDDLITDSIKVCKEHGSAISLNDCVLCVGVRSSDGVFTSKGVDRDTLALLNTPQSVKYGLLCDLYQRAEKMGVLETMDPHITTLMYKTQTPMYFSKGSPLNIKITTKDDLDFFEAYLILRERGSSAGKERP